MKLRLSKDYFLLAFDLWWLVFLTLETTGFNSLQLLNIVSFISLFVVPGFLLLLIMRTSFPAWINIALCFALSILVLMVTGLIGNTLLPFLGVSRPLENPYLLGEISIAAVILAFVAWLRESGERVLTLPSLWNRDAVVAAFPILFVILSVAGADTLNNGGSSFFTMTILAAIAGYVLYVLWQSETLAPYVIPTALFGISLALLFMTSLRGWYVTGHDVQREFQVFQLTKGFGHWSMLYYRDAYNACLSITILPTMLANIFKISDPYIYKVLYQIMFAAVVPVAYHIARRLLSVRLALLSSVFFLSFPTFFEDMPFLTRQEIAFLFFALVLYVLFENAISSRLRTALLLPLSLGLILSHYSTTYTIIAIFGLAWLFTGVTRFVPLVRTRLFAPDVRRISLVLLLSLVCMSFIWTVVITQTGGNVQKVLAETLTSVSSSFTDSGRSVDALSLISFHKPETYTNLKPYIANTVLEERALEPEAYYGESTFTQYQYPTTKEEKLPPSRLSNGLLKLHINAPSIVSFVGQGFAKVIELCVFIGFVLLFWGRARAKVETEWFLIAFASLVFIGLTVLLPVLSTEYGVFRALQQSLFLFAPLIVLALWWLGSFVGPRFAAGFTVGVTLFFFLYSSAFIPQLFGGNAPALHLNNTGFYYDKYVTVRGEEAAAAWLRAHSSEGNFEVEADRFATNKLAALGLRPAGDLFPGLIKKNAYVFLDSENVQKDQSSVLYGSTLLTYTYPGFLDQQKDLVYSNAEAKIYK